MRRLIVFVSILLSCASANAGRLVTIDPDNYDAGVNLTWIAPGVVVRSFRQTSGAASTYSPIISVVVGTPCDTYFPCGGHEGTMQFKASGGTERWNFLYDWDACANRAVAGACLRGFQVMDVRFYNPTNLLQLETSFFSDASGLIAYNSSGVELFRCSMGVTSCTYDTTISYSSGSYAETLFVITRPTADISRIVFAGESGNASIGQISFWLP